MFPNLSRLLAIAVLLSITASAGAAQVYKWIDEDGVTHYSQQPPPSGTPTVITPDTAPPDETAGGQSANAEGQDGEANNENGDGNDGQETIAGFCKELRDKEKILQSDRPIRIKAEDGTLTNLDDEGRAQRLEQIQSQLRDHCQGLDAQGGDGG